MSVSILVDGVGAARSPHAIIESTDGESENWVRGWDGFQVGVWMAAPRIVEGLFSAHFFLVMFPSALIQNQQGASVSANWLGAYARWDASHHVQIATQGCSGTDRVFESSSPDRHSSCGTSTFFHFGLANVDQAGCAVVCSAFIAASSLLYRLVGRHFGQRAALVSVAMFCWFPT
jgi:hypothetical protein